MRHNQQVVEHTD